MKPLARLKEQVSTAGAMMAVRHLCIGVLFVTCLCHAAVEEPAKSSANSTHAQTPGVASNTLQTLPGESSEAPILASATNAQGFLKIAYSHYGKEEYKEAIAPFKMALLLEPTNYEANLYLGYTYYYLSNFEAAAQIFRRWVRSRPENAEAQYWLASTFYALHHFAEAVPAFRATLALDPNQSEAWLYLGCSQFYVRDYEHAAESLRRFAVADPTNYLGHMWLGYTRARQGSYNQAGEAFGRAASLNPGDYDANYWCGSMLLRGHHYVEAVPSLERALISRPGDRSVQFLLLAAYLITGQTNRISALNLGFALPFSILLASLYLPTVGLLLWKSLRVQPRPAPGLIFSTGWFFSMVIGQTGFGLIAFYALSLPTPSALWFALSFSAAPLIAATFLGFARQPWGTPFAWPPQMPHAKLLLGSVLALGAVGLFDVGYKWLVQHITNKPMPGMIMAPWFNAIIEERSWLGFSAVSFVAPLTEEILFRGLLFGAIGKRLSAWWTIVVTAAIFAVVHMQVTYFIPVFAVGLLLGWARHKSGGLALPVILHCVNNSLALIVAMLRSIGG